MGYANRDCQSEIHYLWSPLFFSCQTEMPCRRALPEFIISGNGVMINLIAAVLPCCKDEAKERLCLVAGKKEKGQEKLIMSTPMSERIPSMPEGSLVIVPLSIIVGFLLMLLLIVASIKP